MAAPVLEIMTRSLKREDLVFIDNTCGVNGHQIDKTKTYMFGRSLP